MHLRDSAVGGFSILGIMAVFLIRVILPLNMKVKKHKSGGNSLNVQSILQDDISFSQKNLKQMQNINHLASYRVAI